MVRRSIRSFSLWFILPTAFSSSALAYDSEPYEGDDDDVGEAAEPDADCLLDTEDDEPVEVVRVQPETPTASNLGSLEAAIIDETNVLRRDPRAYAEKLVRLRPSYRGRLIQRPGKASILTQEGVAALDEAIAALERAPQRLSRLAHADGLSRAARDHARDLGRSGDLGHVGSDGSGPDTRAKRHGTWDGMVAENISFGPTSAEEIVIGLLVDDGVKNRGHREILLTRELYFAGAACGPHPTYGTTCVMTYATSFKTRGQSGRTEVERDADQDQAEVRPTPDPWRSPSADDASSDDDEDTWTPEPRRPDTRPPAPYYGPRYPGPRAYPEPRYYPGPRYYPPGYRPYR